MIKVVNQIKEPGRSPTKVSREKDSLGSDVIAWLNHIESSAKSLKSDTVCQIYLQWLRPTTRNLERLVENEPEKFTVKERKSISAVLSRLNTLRAKSVAS